MKHLEHVRSISAEDRTFLSEARSVIARVLPGAAVCVYGSAARGARDPDSDLDLLILTAGSVSQKEEQRLIDALYDLELARGVVLSLLWYTRDEWNAARTCASPFRQRVEAEAVLV